MSNGEDIRPDDLPEVPQNPEEEGESGPVAEQKRGTNESFRRMMDRNFLDYANYVIGSRAIPDVDDGLKPVQRRILWALYLVYDGRTQKEVDYLNNVIGREKLSALTANIAFAGFTAPKLLWMRKGEHSGSAEGVP